jgi:hypothetical protein
MANIKPAAEAGREGAAAFLRRLDLSNVRGKSKHKCCQQPKTN